MAVSAPPDGRRALSRFRRQDAQLWDLETGNPLAPSRPIPTFSPSPSRRLLHAAAGHYPFEQRALV